MDTEFDERTVHRLSDNRALPPRERILIAARELFIRHGFHAAGVDAIAEAAGTNKMTLYRHFESKDLLIAECLRGLAGDSASKWDTIDGACPNDPRAAILTWVKSVGHHAEDDDHSDCALVNAAIQITDPEHPGRKVVDDSKRALRDKLVSLCRAAGFAQPSMLADQLFLMVEGARVSYRGDGGGAGLETDLVAMTENLFAAHQR